MSKKFFALAMSVAVAGVLAGSAFADNTELQTSFGPISPNTAIDSNNDTLSHNNTDTNNYQPIASFNNGSINNSGNTSIPITNSFNDTSYHSKDSHDNESVNQYAWGQVNLNNSETGDINAADHTSTIFDGDVKISSGGYGYGCCGTGDNNINTGIMADSIQGDESAQFTNVGIGLNDSHVKDSSVNSSSVSNINLLSP